jgi:hypothetical protein
LFGTQSCQDSRDNLIEVKVTTINARHHIRLIKESRVLDEMACDNKQDITWCCRELLRWHSKFGGTEPLTSAARERHRLEDTRPIGRVYYNSELAEIKARNLKRKKVK